MSDLRQPTAFGAAALILALEHVLVRPHRYERMAAAFFRLNAVFSTLMLAAGAFEVFARK